MNNLFFSLLFFPIIFLCAQQKPVNQDVIDSIKNDVWTPFMESYAELDSDKLKSLHTNDIVRILIDQNKIQSGQTYLNDFGGFLEQVEENEGELGIAFAILTTALNGSKDLAYQTGYYEFSSRNDDDQNLVVRGYGHFNVALRKVDGVWKLFMDVDKRVNINLEEFESQEIVYRLDN